MERWARIVTIAVAGVIAAGPAFAQSGSGGGANTTAPQMGTQQPKPSSPSDATSGATTPGKSDSMKSDTMKSDSMKSDTMKSDTMKSDTMKSDSTKSGAMKSDGMKSGAAGAKSDQVRSAQQALKDKGHDPGAIDGVMGPKTQAALRDFQKAEGIQATGRLDAETMSKLGVSAASGRTSSSESGGPAASAKTGGAASSGSSGSSSTSTPGASSSTPSSSKDQNAAQPKK